MKTTIAILAALALSGCSSFNLGAFCYLPHSNNGQCMVTNELPAAKVEPVAAGVKL